MQDTDIKDLQDMTSNKILSKYILKIIQQKIILKISVNKIFKASTYTELNTNINTSYYP